MGKTKKQTLDFKVRQCQYCKLADKRELRKRRPNYCLYKKETGKDPDIRNGHCTQLIATKPRSTKNDKAIRNTKARETEAAEISA